MKLSRQEELGALVGRFLSAMHRYDVGRTLPLLHAAKVTTPQLAVLEFVREPQLVSAIATHVGLSRPATSQLIDKIEQRRWVVRTQGTLDKRERFIVLSSKGRSLLREIADARAARFNASLAVLPASVSSRLGQALLDAVTALDGAQPLAHVRISSRRRS